MQNLAGVRGLQRFHQKHVTARPERRLRCSQSTSGYSLIELLVVVLMMGILAAIAAPGWLAFVNRQQVNKASDAVLSALQEAQREAKKTKLSYSVSFGNDLTNKLPQVAVYRTNDGIAPSGPRGWNILGGDLGLQRGKVVIVTNITGNNTAGSISNPSASTTTNPPQTITFDYMGALAPKVNTAAADVPLKVVVATANPGGYGQSPNGGKRCIIVQTLIGGMRAGKDTDCN